MSWLLDTNVLSEIRKGPRAHASVMAWWRGIVVETVFVSVVTTGEIRRGIERLRWRDAAQSAVIEAWLASLVLGLGTRLLPVNAAVADRGGRITAGRSRPEADALLAATALVHGLTLVTRNTRDLEGLGVPLLNPFQAG